MHFAVQKDVFLTLKYGKMRWRLGLCPGPRWGAYDAPLDPLVGWGGDAFAASNFTPSALIFGIPIVVNLLNDR